MGKGQSDVVCITAIRSKLEIWSIIPCRTPALQSSAQSSKGSSCYPSAAVCHQARHRLRCALIAVPT